MSTTPAAPHTPPTPPGQFPAGPHTPPTPPGQFPAASPAPVGPPGSPSAPPGGAATAGTGAGKRRPWFVLPVLGVVVLLLAGAGGYFGGRSYQGSRASQSCGIYGCIPRLEAATVVKTLQEQGFTCTEDYNLRTCELRIGMVRFEAGLQVAEELIHAINVKIYRAESDPVSETGLAFMSWFAILPYARDAETSAQIEAWLAEQVNGNKDTEAVIGDYVYRLTNPETHSVLLNIRGNF